MPETNTKRLEVFCDGGARGNPGLGGAACVIRDPAGKKRFLCGKYLGWTTNNKAEYEAVKLALQVIADSFEGQVDIDFFLDSNLVASQLSGLFKVKNSALRDIVFEIRTLEVSFGKVYYRHVPRADNAQADKLVNKVIDGKKDFREITSE
jgi:ribonuclease HI